MPKRHGGEDTDWTQIVMLYDMLLHLTPSPVTRLHRAVALSEVDALAAKLDGYHLFHAARAELLRDLGCAEQARAADERALTLTANPAERSVLRRRLSWG
jgi:predicted RNA polymerase sigma factor